MKSDYFFQKKYNDFENYTKIANLQISAKIAAFSYFGKNDDFLKFDKIKDFSNYGKKK